MTSITARKGLKTILGAMTTLNVNGDMGLRVIIKT